MKKRGRGIACMWYPIGFTVAANPSAAVVKVNEDGTATLLTGTVETGQGSLTILAQIVAQELGISTDDVHVVSADTDTTPMDTGAIASRTTYVTGSTKLLGGVEMCSPGDNVKMEVELMVPIAMDDGVRFAIREGGKTVGSGVVTKILD